MRIARATVAALAALVLALTGAVTHGSASGQESSSATDITHDV